MKGKISVSKMSIAFVLINAEIGAEDEVLQKIQKIEGV
jgi:hypothetical protein